MTKVACGNCDWTGDGIDCDEIDDFFMRHEAGGEVAAGECPDCGALAFLVKPPARVLITIEGGCINTVSTDSPRPLAFKIKDWDALDEDIDSRNEYLDHAGKFEKVEVVTPEQLDMLVIEGVIRPQPPVPMVWRICGALRSYNVCNADDVDHVMLATVRCETFDVVAMDEAVANRLATEVIMSWPEWVTLTDRTATVYACAAIRKADKPKEPA
jgi:hypothetical protein